MRIDRVRPPVERYGVPVSGFPPEDVRALAEAIAVHDEVDLAATPPLYIPLDFDAALLDRCYWLSCRLWAEAELDPLRRLSTRLVLTGRLSDAELRTLKDIRARAKQLRFAYATLRGCNAYPPILDRLTRYMGQAQDAARTRRRARAAVRGMLLRLMLLRIVVSALRREIGAFKVASPPQVASFILAEIETARRSCTAGAVTDRTFHDTRKIVSRLVAFYDTLKVIAPSDHHHATGRYLSTINGLMGAIHDRMVERKTVDRKQYSRTARPLPPSVSVRLHNLVEAFRTARPDGLRAQA